MKAEVVFLGTSTGVPTKDRSHASVFFRYGKHRFLFDCGEGTQRQLLKANKSAMKVEAILISHFHGDHVLGLPGLIQSLDFLGREKTLKVFGPEGIQELVKLITRIPGCDPRFSLEARIARGKILETKDYSVSSFPLKHSIPSLGYVFQEKPRKHVQKEKLVEIGLEPGPEYEKLKQGHSIEWKGEKLKPEDYVVQEPGLKVGYVADTRPCDSIIENAHQADLLIHEATFAHDALDMAKDTMHSTAREAGENARKARVKQLALMHYSPRYKDENLDKLRQDAGKEFNNVLMARDFDKIEL